MMRSTSTSGLVTPAPGSPRRVFQVARTASKSRKSRSGSPSIFSTSAEKPVSTASAIQRRHSKRTSGSLSLMSSRTHFSSPRLTRRSATSAQTRSVARMALSDFGVHDLLSRARAVSAASERYESPPRASSRSLSMPGFALPSRRFFASRAASFMGSGSAFIQAALDWSISSFHKRPRPWIG